MPKLAVCDYPEQVSPTDWQHFPAKMRQLGIEYVRIGEFAWSRLEPKREQFDFTWLDTAIETLHQHNLKVVLCTPTATPPAWLVQEQPSILPVGANGQVRGFGSRRHYDFASDVYWQETERIVTALAKRYGQHAAVVGWQTDNEYGCHNTTHSYSTAALLKFRAWLEQKYTSLEKLNAAWGNAFWSQDYSAWSEIGLPNQTVTEPNPSHVLDFYRFSSQLVVRYNQMQTKILREHSPNRFVTHNFMLFFGDFDHYAAAAHLDFVSWDNYPTGMLEMSWLPETEKNRLARVGHPDLVGFHHDLYYGLKQKPFWVMEQQCGQINWAPHNPLPATGAVTLWTLQAFAHGAQTVSYFRWQAAQNAQEQYHSGLLRHDSTPDRGFLEVERLAKNLPKLSNAPKQTQVCLLHDYESLWAFDQQKHSANSSYWAQVLMYYSALRQLGLDVAVCHPMADLSSYALIVAPALILGSSQLAAHLEQYAQNGASVVLGARSGFKNQHGGVAAPNHLARLAGVRIKNFDSLRQGVHSTLEAFEGSYKTHTWNESLEPLDPDLRLLGTYFEDPLYSEIGLTYRAFSSGGGVMYIGVWGEALIKRSLEYALFRTGVNYTELEPNLRLTRRGGQVYAQNWSHGGLPLPLEPETEFAYGSSILEPFGVAVYSE
ncbi:MAG: beta-galactosidase [Deinococcales bacterium]